jgi:hypothetical protein
MGKVVVGRASARTGTVAGGREAVSPDDPLCAVAMLRVAVEMKKPDARGLDEIIEGVLERMRLDREAFRRFLAENGQLLRASAAARGYTR